MMTKLLYKAMARLAAPGGKRGLAILIYHRVLAQRDPLFPGEVDRADFDRQVALLASCFNIIPLIDAVRHLAAGTLPPGAACITFDDGYADNAEVALPVLQAHGVSATFFIASGFLNGGRMWNDSVIETVRGWDGATLDAGSIGLGLHACASIGERRAAIAALIGQLKYLPMEERLAKVDQLAALASRPLPADIMMNTEQVRRLHQAGMGIGAHTVNHPILARIPIEQARAEIAQGRAALQAMIGAEVPLFAYPNGKPGDDYRHEHVALVRELGFEGAVSTSWGAPVGPPDLLQLPRFTPWDRSAWRFVLRLGQNSMRHASVALAA